MPNFAYTYRQTLSVVDLVTSGVLSAATADEVRAALYEVLGFAVDEVNETTQEASQTADEYLTIYRVTHQKYLAVLVLESTLQHELKVLTRRWRSAWVELDVVRVEMQKAKRVRGQREEWE